MIHSALHLFEKQGFHGVTVNQIVESIGTSKGGFYHHFTSKDELLFVIHDTFITYVL
ncbi:TetR/AcrR family transcriptional regulator, partial [Ornithinibacillus scapharcae]|uniref:TetR/AcrR family transcriptional regulator n=1 Tax=Ornithinibacillus scapharcae TaxID=1147159 RepID=UPI00110FBD3D